MFLYFTDNESNKFLFNVENISKISIDRNRISIITDDKKRYLATFIEEKVALMRFLSIVDALNNRDKLHSVTDITALLEALSS
jgi:hypothetical protein